MPRSPEQRILNAARKLIGLQITGVRYMTQQESTELCICNRALILSLSDGPLLYPMADDEGNEAGVLMARATDGQETHFSSLQR